MAVGLLRELAAEALADHERLDLELQGLLGCTSDTTIIRSLPSERTVLTAELAVELGKASRSRSAGALASNAVPAPRLKQSDKSRALRRFQGGKQDARIRLLPARLCHLRPAVS